LIQKFCELLYEVFHSQCLHRRAQKLGLRQITADAREFVVEVWAMWVRGCSSTWKLEICFPLQHSLVESSELHPRGCCLNVGLLVQIWRAASAYCLMETLRQLLSSTPPPLLRTSSRCLLWYGLGNQFALSCNQDHSCYPLL